MLVALLLLLAIPVKTGLFFWLPSRLWFGYALHFRAGAGKLQNSASSSRSTLPPTAGSATTAVVAITIALSFVAASMFNAHTDDLYVAAPLAAALRAQRTPGR